MKSEITQIMNERVKNLYHAMWTENRFAETLPIQKSVYKGILSNNSYSFDIQGNSSKEKRERLKQIFAIQNTKRFDEKFAEACSGSAKESNRITTLHSSSLCALLFFYNVTRENPLTIEMDEKNVVFTDVVFEFQNMVIEGRNPSNVDIVLLGKYHNQKVLLFLESKFSEYYQAVRTTLDIPKAYLDTKLLSGKIYTDEKSLCSLGVKKKMDTTKETFQICSEQVAYLEGMKQMVSHCIGVNRFMVQESNVQENSKSRNVCAYYDSETLVYLGTIVFDKYIGQLKIGRGEATAFVSYQNLYRKLAVILNEQAELPQNFKLVSDVITYSLFELNRHKVEANILKFYFGDSF